jgi:ribosome-binding protein aMBF1 (putative translation factor)
MIKRRKHKYNIIIQNFKTRKDMFCSFCGKNAMVVKTLITSGSDISICNECVELCVKILNEKKEIKND